MKKYKRKVIVTAGGTIEPIDPVRYISNRSSGKMGIAIAKYFKRFFEKVILIYGKIEIPLPASLKKESIKIETGEQLYKAIKKELTDDSILIMAAAVCDYKPELFSEKKLKKRGIITLKLIPVRDILLSLAEEKKRNNIFIGFAAETEELIKNAEKKLKEKKLDLIIANKIYKKGYPFGSDYNRVVFITEKEKIRFPELKKEEIAKEIYKFLKKNFTL